MNEQELERKRVRDNIGGAILEFFALRGVGAEFYEAELRRFLEARSPAFASESPTRIMRDLNQRRDLAYESLGKTLYRILPVAPLSPRPVVGLGGQGEMFFPREYTDR